MVIVLGQTHGALKCNTLKTLANLFTLTIKPTTIWISQ